MLVCTFLLLTLIQQPYKISLGVLFNKIKGNNFKFDLSSTAVTFLSKKKKGTNKKGCQTHHWGGNYFHLGSRTKFLTHTSYGISNPVIHGARIACW